MRPRVRAMSKAQIGKNLGRIGAGVKNYAKNVAGGAKIVGGALKKAAKWPANQIEKEWRGEDKAIEDFRKKQRDSGWIN